VTSESPRRRPLESRKQNTEGRNGCIITGAVLGIIFGATFAFYGLPPILRSIYGEEKVAVGQAYDDGSKTIQVEYVRVEPERVSVGLRVLITESWPVNNSTFSLELSERDEWVQARPPAADRPETSLGLRIGEEREVVLVFDVAPGDGDPDALHVSGPRIRFALPPPEAP
jgi:hypothetical protein